MAEGRLRDGNTYAGRPSVCRSCGALVGAGEAACMMCGASVTATPAPREARAGDEVRHADPETRRFVHAIVSRPAPFTLIFLTVCIFLFLLMKASGVDHNPTAVLDAYGAKINSRIDAGEWWRFITPIFLHGGPTIGWLHLLVNMYGLFMLGPYVEKLYGSAKFVFFWVATGAGGTLASYLTLRPESGDSRWEQFLFRQADVPSVGASGALFGLVGVLFVFGIKYRRELPEGFKRAFGTGMLPMIVINIFIGFTISIIDNAAHLGGLFSGALLALFIDYKRPDARGPVAVFWHVTQAASLALVVLSFVMVARNFAGPRPGLENMRGGARPQSIMQNVPPYTEAMNEGQNAFRAGVDEGNANAVESAIEKLNNAPPLDEQADALREELIVLLTRTRDVLVVEERARESQVKQLKTDFEEWEARFDGWVTTEGGRYRLYLDKSPPQPEEERGSGNAER